MVGEKIVRVECNTCHGIHNFHPVKPVKDPPEARPAGKTGVPRKQKADPEATAAAEWEELQAGMDTTQSIPYDMGRAYRKNNLLLHPKFGIGIVQIVMPCKIEVLFQEGKKLLRCG